MYRSSSLSPGKDDLYINAHNHYGKAIQMNRQLEDLCLDDIVELLVFLFWPNFMCLRVISLNVHLHLFLTPKKQFGWSSITNVIKMHHQKTFVVIILHYTERCFVELDFHGALNIISHLISFTFMRALSPPLASFRNEYFSYESDVDQSWAYQNHCELSKYTWPWIRHSE